MQFSHIFEKSIISIEKVSISNEKNLVFRSKNPVFQIKKFEILGFLHIEFEILGISSEIPGISNSRNFD